MQKLGDQVCLSPRFSLALLQRHVFVLRMQKQTFTVHDKDLFWPFLEAIVMLSSPCPGRLKNIICSVLLF